MSACALSTPSAGSARQANPETLDLQRFLILVTPPEVTATRIEDVERAQGILANLRREDLEKRLGARFENANALPWLAGSTIGRQFLRTKGPRVLVRGKPRASCPAAIIESGEEPVPDLAAAALRTCLAESTKGCGCQVVAAGSVLLVEQSDVAYATAISARIRVPSLGLDGLLVAEEDSDGAVLLRDLKGVVGRIERTGSEQVLVRLNRRDGVFRGRSIKVGFRRGRLAERIYAQDESGNRLSLLIGFDPAELSKLAGAWLAWPKG